MSIFFWKNGRKHPFSSQPSVPKPSLGTRRRVPKRRPLYSRRLELERLEDRIVPSLTLISHYTGLDSAGVGGGGEPPDTQGAAGPSSVVETVNQGIGIFSPKDTGSTAVTDTLADFFFKQGGLPHVNASDEQSDPFTIYDPQVQRFIAGDLDFQVDSNGNPVNNGGNALLLAVSKSDNPATLTNSDWFFYEVSTKESGVALQDYPGNVGYNADALVVTLNPFDSNGAPLSHSLVNAISINALINGTPLTVGTNLFQTDDSEFLMRPTTMPDSKPGGPMWLVAEHGDNKSIDVIRMDNVLSSSPTFTPTNLAVNPYHQAVNEKDPGGNVDTSADSRILQVGEAGGLLAATHEISDAAGDDDLVRWYEVNVSSGTPVLQQQGDIGGGPGVYDAYQGININAAGDIATTYIQSGTAAGMFESMYITGRTPSDAPGTMEAPVLIQTGLAHYNGTREGDMSRISVDADGSFWAFSQWANNETAPNWGTAIAHFTFVPPIAVTLSSATEGQALVNVPVATFIDNSGVPLSSYTATIDWGDGTTTSGTVVAGSTSNTFLILGSHTYIEEGNYTLTASENNGMTTLTASGVVAVADAPLSGNAQALNGQAGAFVNNALVAVFTDTDPTLETPANYTATIQWFEGNGLSFSSTGFIKHLFDNTFAVFGSSPDSFPSGGLFTVRVVVRDAGGASVTVDSVINVAHNPAIPPLVPQYQAETNPFNALLVALEDALTNLLHAEQLFLFALNFGTMPQKQASFGNLLNAFFAYESAIFQYDMHLPGA